MLTTEIKNKIDSARNILVGKVPDPKAQVEQITTALIYKFMDDMDKRAMSLPKGKAQFFTNGYEKYSWSKMMDTKLGGQERLNLYAEAIAKMSKNPHLPPLFCNIFKDAFLPYRDPETLTLFLKEINFFQYDHSENLGDAFEYLLSILGSQGDAGQFRTPRHIIDFIVEIIDPKKDESILDPACGTAGFLISAYKHILKANKEKILNPDEKESLMNNLSGYDISPDMVRLSQVNMYLHGFPNPHIYEYDTLTSEEKWEERFDVMMANPPFMTPRGGIRPHKRFSVQANRCEVLFVDYIMEHLNNKGRAGIIVPEGIIFQSGKAYKELRKSLVNDGLFAVVSLPAGVFNPYSGVKTSILFFDNEIAKKTKDFLFVKVESDGYDLGAQRRKIEKNDLEDASLILNSFRAQVRNGENQETIKSFISRTGKGLIVSKDKIAETGDYNLSADRYRVVTNDRNAKYELIELGKVCEIFNGSTPKRTENNYWENGTIPWFTIDDIRKNGRIIRNTQQFITEKGFNESSVKILPKHTTLICCTASVGEYAYTEIELTTNQQFNGLVIKEEYRQRLDSKFLFWCVTKFKDELIRMSGKSTFNFVSVGTLKKFKIPIPPIEIQKRIVEQIEVKQKILDGAKAIVENWKPEFNINNEWKTVKLSEISEYFIGLTYSPEDVSKAGTIVLRSSNIQNGELDFSDIVRVTKKIKETLFVKDGDILMCSRNGSKRLVGKTVSIKKLTEKMTFGTFMTIIRSEHSKYLSYFFNTDYFRKQISGSETSSINQITKSMLDLVIVPLPPFEVESQIIEKVEKEKEIIESNKKLIDIMQKKINEVLETL